MMAQVAIRMGEFTAKKILRDNRGEIALVFRYRDPALLATIGKNEVVAKIHGMEVKGFTAWFVWLLVRLLAIVGFHNRFVVPINWAWEHIFLQEGR